MQRAEARRAFWKELLEHFERDEWHLIATVNSALGANPETMDGRRVRQAAEEVKRELRRKAGI
jgi:hypothetical protein